MTTPIINCKVYLDKYEAMRAARRVSENTSAYYCWVLRLRDMWLITDYKDIAEALTDNGCNEYCVFMNGVILC